MIRIRVSFGMTLDHVDTLHNNAILLVAQTRASEASGKSRPEAVREAFDPRKPSAAHKYLPLPTNVKVTNLENGKSMVLRVNDRGPFVQGRIIDVSAGAAKRLGFYDKGTAQVRVETIELD